MNVDEYQDFTDTTAIYKDTIRVEVGCPKCGHRFVNDRTRFAMHALYLVLGMVGEMGEIAEKLKKHMRGGGDLSDFCVDPGLEKEFGDLGYYFVQGARHFGFRASQIFRRNKEKLRSRQQRGVVHGDGDER